MKDNIFIVWSGNHGQQLATQTKNKLESHGYHCIVGGEGGLKNGMHVGTAIISQMQTCTQAIVIVQKKENGSISNNLFFEWGFLISHLGDKKVHARRRHSLRPRRNLGNLPQNLLCGTELRGDRKQVFIPENSHGKAG